MVKAVKAVIVFGTQAELTKIAAFVKGGISELEVLPLWTQQHVDLVPMAAIDLELEEILSFTSDSVDWQSIALRLREESPDLVVVQGDTRSALNGAFAASKLKIPVMHLEAGLRLSTELEPEERARRRITRLSAYHVVTSRKSKDNLIEEGVSQDNIIQIPHLAELYLSYLYSLDKGSLEEGMFDEPYIVVTMHRTTNLDLVIECADSLSRLGSILDGIQMVFVKRPDPRWNDLYNSLKKTENVLLSQTLIPSRPKWRPPSSAGEASIV
ncbi:MAG: UDP-N-acetylglucosamine 2-epimerase [Candidatus Thiodiazotropha endolucinida]|nr:UDP-N-acetylglucosamine 2-epimerase [Candidatus Thiodiazotropha taylori]MCW4249378.1 UDP-N-acetylglucosamine 2-epimerase [Candidatus Thiodiazotropha endolucinida]MCG7892706.1 UDP-N-acetylglucosamine 2-epimerase [Candidatus Thiodiazotropha taylori]MCG8062547.1 UDP-N-acetylglucosamine 2-epimerase [Candidatus Thiodiazotropha taylori]MCW4273371.1 UDP-N-acetylglucosamine 2-epimerase [Candidatus Thiodiazotropha endolucinida]